MCSAARLRALDGIGPEELGVDRLLRRVQEQGVARGDPGAGRHRRRPDHQPLPGRAPAAARLRRHPARPWRAGRRRAHLSRRGHARTPPCARASGSLDRRAQVLTSRQLFTTRNELPPHGPARDPAGPASCAEDQGQAGRPGRRRAAPARRRHVRDHVQGPGHRPRGAPGRRLGALVVIDVADGEERRPMALVNPEIVWRSGEQPPPRRAASACPASSPT